MFDAVAPADSPLLLDLSRLLARAGRLVPTGIDRVELAYAQHYLNATSHRVSFAGMASWGRFGMLDRRTVATLVDVLTTGWSGRDGAAPGEHRAEAARIAAKLKRNLIWRAEGELMARSRNEATPFIYLLVSHHHLERPGLFRRMKERAGARFVGLIHDLIPFQHPEFVRPGQAERHARRMETMANYADAVIANSLVTQEAFQPFLDGAGRFPPVVVAPLGVDMRPPAEPRPRSDAFPYFVCIATIEPRKNHLLLLNVWRRLTDVMGAAAPRLVLVGQRGWENENVVDMIERCSPLVGVVTEYGGLPDAEVASLLLGARALVLPSFVEGYGLPLAEALSLGTPALCSDIPALREVGGDTPEYLDPLDGPGWLAAVMDYARPDSARRAQQVERIGSWRPPSWPDHFRAVDGVLKAVTIAAT